VAQGREGGAGRLLGVVFEAVVPVGVVERDLEHGVAGERQPVAAGRQADHAVPGGVAAGATDDHPRRHLVLRLERPQLAVVLVQEPRGRPPKHVRNWRRHGGAGENRATPRTRPRRPPGGPAGPDAVTDARSMAAASSRRANRPARGKSGNSTPSPASMSMVRPPLRTTTTFSGHSSMSGGRNMSSSQAVRTAGSALVAKTGAGIGSTPSLTTSTSISPTRSA